MTREQEAVERLTAWIRDFGHEKNRIFIEDLQVLISGMKQANADAQDRLRAYLFDQAKKCQSATASAVLRLVIAYATRGDIGMEGCQELWEAIKVVSGGNPAKSETTSNNRHLLGHIFNSQNSCERCGIAVSSQQQPHEVCQLADGITVVLDAQTPEQRAQAVLNTFWFGKGFQASSTMIDAVAATIREALAEEREACILDAKRSLLSSDRSHIGCTYDALVNEGQAIEAAIRARGNA